MSAVVVQRARPWLGTIVQMRVDGLRERGALAAIDAAFDEVATIHRLMSFHSTRSDLSELHRASPGCSVRVDTRTYEVLRCALHVAEVSNGCFDPTVAAEQVAWGFLPRPQSPFEPEPRANWRDIELLDDQRVRLRRALWIDLGGIAKGYAVDRAIDTLRSAGATQICVNAGGDLRIEGERAEVVHLPGQEHRVEIANAAIASSSAKNDRRKVDGYWRGLHVDGATRRSTDTLRGVSVVARECVIADALTKVVLASQEEAAKGVLARFGAQACVREKTHSRLLDAA